MTPRRFLPPALAALLVLFACEPPAPEGRVEPVDRVSGVDTLPSPSSRPQSRPEPPSRTDTAEAAPDTGRTESFYIHLRSGVDPRALARRHGITPSEMITGPRPGLVARLTPAQQAALQADSLVRSLAREIHQGETDTPGPIRTLGSDTTGL